MTFALRNISSLLDDNIVAEVSQGREQFMKIQKDIQHAVNQTIPIVSASIRRAGDSLAQMANNITTYLDKGAAQIDRTFIREINHKAVYIEQYSPYRFVPVLFLKKKKENMHKDEH